MFIYRFKPQVLALPLVLALLVGCSSTAPDAALPTSTPNDTGFNENGAANSTALTQPACTEGGSLPERLETVVVIAGEPVDLPLGDLTSGHCVELGDDRDFDLGALEITTSVVTFIPPSVPDDIGEPTEPWWGQTTARLCTTNGSCTRLDFEIYPADFFDAWQTMDEAMTKAQEANGEEPRGLDHEPQLYTPLARSAMSAAGTSPAGIAAAQDAAGSLFLSVASRDFVEEAAIRYAAAAMCSGPSGALAEAQLITLDAVVYMMEAVDLFIADVDAFTGTDPSPRYSAQFRDSVDEFTESMSEIGTLIDFVETWAELRDIERAVDDVARGMVVEALCNQLVTSAAG